jgi:ADP-dependent NAD(P)H-hydrate dehydratase
MNPIQELPIPHLPRRKSDSHKGTYGTVLLVGGSRGMSGAVALSGMAALRGGAGLVRLAVPSACLETVAQFEPAYTTLPMPSDAEGRLNTDSFDPIFQATWQATVTAIGPGLGRSDQLDSMVRRLYSQLPGPLVVDADALNALAGSDEFSKKPAGLRILTPHPGEFARLVGAEKTDPDSQAQAAIELAGKLGVVIVLKGFQTLVTDGTNSTRNMTGNPGMATGGAGDVLTGLTAALWAQSSAIGLDMLEVARLAVYLHGLSGDLAARALGSVSMTASDIVQFLSAAFLVAGDD